ncbi:VIP peptides isoform X2 [Rhinatrema bivittatum]|uniref:VIP peptides isoform X2 n=1 Tax=Rhinatrema bivittatum TaxID=194408 RepID=UPI0011281DB5|nr:VIP peptides isoform X2 [Rhinatrema bivittatum]
MLIRAMDHRNRFQLPVAFTLLSLLCFGAHASASSGAYSAVRLGNRMSFDGPSEPDQIAGSLKADTDILQNALPENDKLYFDVNNELSRTSRQHADAIFTENYSRVLKQIAARNYLQSIFGKPGKPVKRHSDAVFTDNYSRLRKQLAVKNYLNSVLNGKRSQEDINPANLRQEPNLIEPPFSENFDDVMVDELLSHLPLSI